MHDLLTRAVEAASDNNAPQHANETRIAIAKDANVSSRKAPGMDNG